jgi:hypothetical protein
MPSDPAEPSSPPPRRNFATASLVLGTAAIPAGLLRVVLADSLLPYELAGPSPRLREASSPMRTPAVTRSEESV